jgi:hypothetical protein
MPLLLLSTADGVDLIEKEHDWPVRSGRLEDSTDTFRSGAGVLPDQLRASDMMEVDAKLPSHRLSKKVLSGPLRAVEENSILSHRGSLFTQSICSYGQHVLFCASSPTDVSQFGLGDV